MPYYSFTKRTDQVLLGKYLIMLVRAVESLRSVQRLLQSSVLSCIWGSFWPSRSELHCYSVVLRQASVCPVCVHSCAWIDPLCLLTRGWRSEKM